MGGGGRGRRQAAGQQQGVRAQTQPEHQSCGGVGQGGEYEGTSQGGNVQSLGQVCGEPDEIGADDRAEGSGEKHGAHRPSAPRRGGQVGSGVAGLQVGGGARAVDEKSGEEQHDAVEGGGRHDPCGAEGAGEVAGG